MKSLSDLLGDAIKEKEAKVASVGGGGTWENLSVDREYRVKVLESKVGALNSGAPVLDLTLEVVEPSEYAGRRIWNSWFDSGQSFQVEQIAELYVALGVTGRDLPQSDDYNVIFGAVAPIILDRVVIIACRNSIGNDGQARTKVRWVNADNGRPLRTNLKPPKSKGGASPDLAVDVSAIIRPPVQDPFPATQPLAPAQSGAIPQPSGIRLPGGLPGR